MKLTRYLYNFAKVFIPGAIFLCIIFNVSHYIPKKNPVFTGSPPATTNSEEKSLPKQSPPIEQKKPQKPSYIYIVEFKSGGTMKCKNITLKNNIVTIWVDDGYSVKMSKNDIQKINKMKL